MDGPMLAKRPSNEVRLPSPLNDPSVGAIIGPEFALDVPVSGGISPNDAFMRAISINGDVALIVWEEGNFDGEKDIIGARVSKSGQLLDPIGFPISLAAGNQYYPAVASDGENFLVVWEDYGPEHNFQVFGARVMASGAVLDPQGLPISRENEGGIPKVVSNGRNYFVVWQLFPGLAGRRLAQNGSLLEKEPVLLTSKNTAFPFDVATNGEDYLAVWEQRPDNDPNGPGDIFATRVTGDATVLDPTGIPICVAPNRQTSPSAASVNGDYLVAWDDNRLATRTDDLQSDIYVARITAGGKVLETNGVNGSVLMNS